MAAKLLREDIVKKLDVSDLSWLPTLEAVSDDFRKPPDSVYMFLQKLPKNKASANVS